MLTIDPKFNYKNYSNKAFTAKNQINFGISERTLLVVANPHEKIDFKPWYNLSTELGATIIKNRIGNAWDKTILKGYFKQYEGQPVFDNLVNNKILAIVFEGDGIIAKAKTAIKKLQNSSEDLKLLFAEVSKDAQKADEEIEQFFPELNK